MDDNSNGRLEAYYEQGMEGRIVFSFIADNDLPRGHEREAMVSLKDGHDLTIFDGDGTILWSGTIKLVKRRWWDKHKLTAPIWTYRKQKGVPYWQWMDWFWRKRPLRATLS